MPGYIENFKQIQNRTEKEKTEKDKLFHPVSYATEHNFQVHSRWIEAHLKKQTSGKNS
jgi:cysteine synthase